MDISRLKSRGGVTAVLMLVSMFLSWGRGGGRLDSRHTQKGWMIRSTLSLAIMLGIVMASGCKNDCSQKCRESFEKDKEACHAAALRVKAEGWPDQVVRIEVENCGMEAVADARSCQEECRSGSSP